MRSRSPGIKAGADDAGAAIDIERLFHSVQIISGSFDTLDDGLRGRVGKLVSWLNEQGPFDEGRREDVELQLRKLLVTRPRLRLASDRQRLTPHAGCCFTALSESSDDSIRLEIVLLLREHPRPAMEPFPEHRAGGCEVVHVRHARHDIDADIR